MKLPKQVIACINGSFMLRETVSKHEACCVFKARRSGSLLDVQILAIHPEAIAKAKINPKPKAITQLQIRDEFRENLKVGFYFLASDEISQAQFDDALSVLQKVSLEESSATKVSPESTSLKNNVKKSPKTEEPKTIEGKSLPDQPLPADQTQKKRKSSKIKIFSSIIVVLSISAILLMLSKDKTDKRPPAPADSAPPLPSTGVVEPKDANAYYELAQKQHEEAKYDNAFENYSKSAGLGNSKAMIALAYYYESGKQSGSPNFDKAVAWYFKAAEAGDKDAVPYLEKLLEKTGLSQELKSAVMIGISGCYKNGLGVGKDIEKAAGWLIKSYQLLQQKPTFDEIKKTANEMKSLSAIMFLANHFEKKKDYRSAYEYFILALDSGAKNVENELKDCLLSLAKEQYQAANYEEGTKTLSSLKEKLSVDLMQLEGSFLRGYGISSLQGHGVDKNISEAEKYLTKAYQAGTKDVQRYLAELYLELSEIQYKTGKNEDSMDSLRKSARYGSDKAQELLYIREFESAAEGLESGNMAMLKELETMAANKDNPRAKEARSLLGENYCKSGQWQDAEKWLSLSLEDGNQGARPLLGRAQFEMAKSFSDKDNQKSFKYLKAAYDNGYKDAAAGLVDHYASGLGCETNIEDAIKIIEQLSFDNPASIPDETRRKFCRILRKKAQISKEEKDYTSAMKYYSKLSEDDYNPDIGERRAAISWAAHFYYHGYGVQKDEDKAIELYEKASSLGGKESSASLHNIYYNLCREYEKKSDHKKAEEYKEKAEEYKKKAEEQGYQWE